jgi:lysophospholipase L1-like esterase/regulator of extracellular matrix RemA (YlzA/DUF370 family)
MTFIAFFNFTGCGGNNTFANTEKNYLIEEKKDQEPTKQIDTIKPKISLIGDKRITLSLNNEYNELLATAIDDVDGNISADISVYGDVNITKEGTYTITYSVKDSAGNSNSIERLVIVKEENEPFSFKPIKKFIQNAKDKKITDATYICVGDSTRAYSNRNGHYIYEDIKYKLKEYNIKSILQARSGYMINDFLNTKKDVNWKTIVNKIKSDGSNTIVDICLGINDVMNQDPSVSNLKSRLTTLIQKIQNQKPNTHFILTMPNRSLKNDNATNKYIALYKEEAKELSLPLNNVIEELMPTEKATKSYWYIDNLHLSPSGQHYVSKFLLKNMLP